jgi:hypothetical protein
METVIATGRRTLPPLPRPAPDRAFAGEDEGQRFVVALRAAAARFAEAAAEPTAMVLQVVPPARHRRARCRVVLRSAAGEEVDLTFLGPVGHPGDASSTAFADGVCAWLGAGSRQEPRWLVPDTDAGGGAAIDLPAWAHSTG